MLQHVLERRAARRTTRSPPTAASARSPSSRSASARQESEPRRRFEHAGAERVGQHHAPGAHRAEQTRHAERRVAAQLQRIAVIIIQAAQDGVHALQPARVFRYTVSSRTVRSVPSDQRQAELAREIGVLEIGLVEADPA